MPGLAAAAGADGGVFLTALIEWLREGRLAVHLAGLRSAWRCRLSFNPLGKTLSKPAHALPPPPAPPYRPIALEPAEQRRIAHSCSV